MNFFCVYQQVHFLEYNPKVNGQCLAALVHTAHRLRPGSLCHCKLKSFLNADNVWEALLNFHRASRQIKCSSIINMLLKYPVVPQWKSLPTRSQSNFWLLLCSAHLSPFWFSLAQEGSSCFLANRSFLSTSHQCRASLLRQRYSVTRISDSEQQHGWVVTVTSALKAAAGVDCFGDVS